MKISVSSLLAEVPDIPDHIARRLVLTAIALPPAALIADPAVGDDGLRVFRANVARWRSGEPLQYIEGDVQFGPIVLRIDPRALIPRPETERLWELAVDRIAGIDNATIIDLCTGSGNLALALKKEISGARVIGIDISEEAIALAKENAADLDLAVDFFEGDLFNSLDGALEGEIDMIVSNPPYVAADEWASLPREIRDHEPTGALVAGPDGTEILERIARQAVLWLRPGGHLLCEIGETQGEDCRRLFAAFEPEIILDLAGRERFVAGCASKSSNLH
jgi:release factor glutamine methyltransferase